MESSCLSIVEICVEKYFLAGGIILAKSPACRMKTIETTTIKVADVALPITPQ